MESIWITKWTRHKCMMEHVPVRVSEKARSYWIVRRHRSEKFNDSNGCIRVHAQSDQGHGASKGALIFCFSFCYFTFLLAQLRLVFVTRESSLLTPCLALVLSSPAANTMHITLRLAVVEKPGLKNDFHNYFNYSIWNSRSEYVYFRRLSVCIKSLNGELAADGRESCCGSHWDQQLTDMLAQNTDSSNSYLRGKKKWKCIYI